MKKILLLSDTHGCADDHILKYARQADEIWHAGDIGSVRVADTLSSCAVFRAVYGNIDGWDVRTTAFHMRRNGRPYQTHRRLPRALRPFGVRGNIRRPAKIIHKRTFAHSESDVRQTLQRDAFQPRSGRHIRFSQSADHVAVRNRLRRNKKPGSHRNRPQGVTASGWCIK